MQVIGAFDHEDGDIRKYVKTQSTWPKVTVVCSVFKNKIKQKTQQYKATLATIFA